MPFSHHKKHSKNSAETHEMVEAFKNIGHEPNIDWVLILVASLIVCVALVASGYLAFVKVGNTLSLPSGNVTTQSVSIDAATLTRVLNQFEARNRERQDLFKTYTGPTDPS